MSIESQSSNESGYGGSSPVFSRQNSNSTLTFNQETATVSFSTSQAQTHSSPHPSLDSASSRRSHPRDAPSPDHCNQRNSNPSSRRDFSDHRRDAEPSYRHSGNHRDSYETSYGHKETSDLSETDSCSSQRNHRSQRYGQTDKAYQYRNGDSQKKSTYSREEYIEPEPEPEVELDGHQVRGSVILTSGLDSAAT